MCPIVYPQDSYLKVLFTLNCYLGPGLPTGVQCVKTSIPVFAPTVIAGQVYKDPIIRIIRNGIQKIRMIN